MQLSELNQKAIINHAQAVAPNECCGFLVSDYMDGLVFYYPCRNQADDPTHYFEIAAEDWIGAERMGEIIAIVHSHPNGEPTLSLADRQIQDLLALDFWLVCGEDLHYFPKIPPLIGREFQHGKTDCYTLFKDFYSLSGADFPNFYREDDWWEKGQNLYLANMARYGFERVAEPVEATKLEERNANGSTSSPTALSLQIGDVILIQVGANVPNHAAIYLGNQTLLHHSPKRLSKRDLYDGYWFKHTHSIWRLNEWQRLQLDFTVALRHLDSVSSSMSPTPPKP